MNGRLLKDLRLDKSLLNFLWALFSYQECTVGWHKDIAKIANPILKGVKLHFYIWIKR